MPADYSKYFFVFLALVLLVLGIILIKPFLASLAGAAIIAYIFYPVYEWLRQKLGNATIAAFISSVIIILIITTPFIFIINSLTKEATTFYFRSRDKIVSGEIFTVKACEYKETFACNLQKAIKGLLDNEATRTYFTQFFSRIATFLTEKTSNVLLSIPRLAINIIIAIMATYYFFKQGKSIVNRLVGILPIDKLHKHQLVSQTAAMIHAVVFGSIIVAVIQGTLGGIGFFIFGFKNPVFWGGIMSLLALIPLLGTWLVWLPAAAWGIISGMAAANNTLLWNGIGLFLWGLLLVSTIDNVLKPIVIGGRAKVHPLIVVVGVLGGLFAFGIVGIFIGPVILALLKCFFDIIETEKMLHKL